MNIFNKFLKELHRKLRPLCPELRSLDLPSNTFKLFFLKNDKSSLEKAKGQIQKYLNVSYITLTYIKLLPRYLGIHN